MLLFCCIMVLLLLYEGVDDCFIGFVGVRWNCFLRGFKNRNGSSLIALIFNLKI